jgi:hypothetical protein
MLAARSVRQINATRRMSDPHAILEQEGAPHL